jgi:peptidyl-tRNA hydrolase, PTH1 family
MRDAGPWLVAGLGNPGERYARTRHNAGAMVVEALCAQLGARLRKVRLLPLFAAEARDRGTQLLLAAPGSFMNESGPPLASFARRRGVVLDRVIACHDEIDLPLGALRIKRGGSTAGHHGLDSMVRGFRSPDFYRVRLGVGRPRHRDLNVDFLLEPFARSELDAVESLVQCAADAVLSLVSEGLDAAREGYTRSGVEDP